MTTIVLDPPVPAVAAQKMAREGCALIDVRTPAEYREVHAEGAHLVPLDRLDPVALAGEHRPGPDRPLLLLCQSGQRAAQAAERLARAGIPEVRVVEGGTLGWVGAGLPVVRGRATMSLERQVRIAAGALVFAGTALGMTVDPWWLLLPGFVGAGLVFAGITDTCGMGMLLAKMPWNR
ncbi:MAG: rhodanese-like domain-containing protein [Verrucomicrobiota bacterium]